MPNVENIRKAIAVMERVKGYEELFNSRLLDMRWWRNSSMARHFDELQNTEEGVLNSCGTTCCFAGWMAVSPEFQDQGVFSGENGVPQIIGMGTQFAEDVIAQLLGISVGDAHDLILGEKFYYKDAFAPNYMGKPMEEITVDDVIERLNSFIK